jgi:hypothetical protein
MLFFRDDDDDDDEDKQVGRLSRPPPWCGDRNVVHIALVRNKFVKFMPREKQNWKNYVLETTPSAVYFAVSCHCPRGWQTTIRAPVSVLKLRDRPFAIFKKV